jgi:RNA polymerase sigma factor (sigma-70 family)
VVAETAAYVARRTGVEEDDLLGEAGLRSVEILAEWTPTEGVEPRVSLWQRLKCALFDYARRTVRRRRFHGEPPADGEVVASLWTGDPCGGEAVTACEGMGNAERRALAEQLLALLTEREQQIMRLRFWEGAENVEIAQQLGVSLGTVERDVANAMRRMRARLEERGADGVRPRRGHVHLPKVGPTYRP